MAVEPFVLGRNHGIFQHWRYGSGGNRPTKLVTTPRKHDTFAIQQSDRAARAPVNKVLQLGNKRVGIANPEADCGDNGQAHAP